MKTIKLLLAVICTCMLLVSCSPVYYAPNSCNVPLMQEKGDLTIQGSRNFEAGKDLQVSYAASKNIGVLLNYMDIKESASGNFGEGNMTEFGIGYYSKASKTAVLEIFAIAGKGSLEHSFSDSQETGGDLTADINKYAIQGNFGFRNKILEFAISVKPTYIHYSNIVGDLKFENENQIDFLNQNDELFLIESALIARLGFKSFKLQAQAGSSSVDDKSRFGKRSNYLAVGMFINFNFFGNN